jgi:hypothetical protein
MLYKKKAFRKTVALAQIEEEILFFRLFGGKKIATDSWK